MIKNLLNADEEPPPGTKVIIEETVVEPTDEELIAKFSAVEENTENEETSEVFETPEDAEFFVKETETPVETAETQAVFDEFAEPEIVEATDTDAEKIDSIETEPVIEEKTVSESANILFQSETKTQTTAETIRQSGLAWSAGIVFFGSIVFMMIFGWFADLLLESSPWGIVGGIVLGAVIGFIQFFRITSQIFKK